MTRTRRVRRTSPTTRGVSVTAIGIAMLVAGIGYANTVLTRVGVGVVVVSCAGLVWVLVAAWILRRGFPHSQRHLHPHPLSVGTPATVTVSLTSTPGSVSVLRHAVVQALEVHEQAAAEITGPGPTRATITRGVKELGLTYTITPTRRGRWPLGPTLVTSHDPWGLWWNDTVVDGAEQVAVWPEVWDIASAVSPLMGEADRVVLGSRSPSPDDAALREYDAGDDLRRVHWPSSARRGHLVVRSDERAGRRPVTVLLHEVQDPEVFEWSVSMAASVALSCAVGGNPVRLLAGDPRTARLSHHDASAWGTTRALLLDSTVDLAPVPTAVGTAHLEQWGRALRHDVVRGEAIIAVLDPLDDATVAALAPLASTGRAFALVRTPATADPATPHRTPQLLRQAGWFVSAATVADNPRAAWLRTVEGAPS